jgi:hypothetical protein
MSRNPPSEPARLGEGWQAIVLGAGVLALVEISRWRLDVGASVFGWLGRGGSFLVVVLGSIVVVTLHHGLVWTLVTMLRRYGERVAFYVSMALALLYGFLWQATVTGGDGLAASQWGMVVRTALGVGIPLGLAALVGFVVWPGRIPPRVRAIALLLVLAGCIAFTLYVFPDYRPFHGYLGGVEAAVAALVLAGRRATRRLSFAVLAVGVVALVALAPRAFAAQGYARRFTRLPGTMLEALPVTRAILPKAELFVDPDARPAGRGRSAPPPALVAAPRGDSVLLEVLEATRSDVWSDPRVAAEFARWKRHGFYTPRAVSQYPATPLAYGAIFTSHPPSVVAQSPHWSQHHLFDLLAPGFRNVFFSQPSERWFDTGAMTSFVTGTPVRARRHESTHQAVTELKSFLAGDAGRQPFFAWMHLFDPHNPYLARGATPKTAPPAERYRSEVKALDTELGRFMDWFYAQPFALRTLVIVVGDHGEALGEVLDGRPYIGHHVYVTDSISHVPLYASGPGLPVGVEDRELALCQLDVMPTIFDHLGVALPARFQAQGMPLSKLLVERPLRSLPTEAFSIRGRDFFDFVKRVGSVDVREQRRFFREMWESGTYPPKLAIERGRWKLVRDAVLRTEKLYDLRADPRETRDVSAERPAELRTMQRALEDWADTQVHILRELEGLK